MMEMKEAYQEKADAQLREWQEWIENFKSDPILIRAKQPGDQQGWMECLDNCHKVARIRLEELRSTREDHWELSKQAVERAMIELKKVLDESGAANSARIVQVQSSRAYVYEPFHRKG